MPTRRWTLSIFLVIVLLSILIVTKQDVLFPLFIIKTERHLCLANCVHISVAALHDWDHLIYLFRVFGKMLWHGTSGHKPEEVLVHETGLDPRFSGKGYEFSFAF